jgi:hypothetical protein
LVVSWLDVRQLRKEAAAPQTVGTLARGLLEMQHIVLLVQQWFRKGNIRALQQRRVHRTRTSVEFARAQGRMRPGAALLCLQHAGDC